MFPNPTFFAAHSGHVVLLTFDHSLPSVVTQHLLSRSAKAQAFQTKNNADIHLTFQNFCVSPNQADRTRKYLPRDKDTESVVKIQESNMP